MLRWMDASKTNLMFVGSQFDCTDAIFRVRLAVPNASDQPSKKGIRIACVKAEDDESRMSTCLHQADGVDEGWVRIIHVCGVPAVLADDFSDFLAHHASEANGCLQQIAANRFSIPQDVIAILLEGFVRHFQ
jgi:hypothetical protein